MKPNPNEIIHTLPRAEIVPSATNRETFSPTALQEMADSITKKGVLQPIIVRPVACIEDEAVRAAAIKAGGKYELVAGERRWRGSEIAGKSDIIALIRELNDRDALQIQAIENVQRENLPPLEEAEQYDHLLKMGGTTVKDIAAEIGKTPAYVYLRVALLRLPDKFKAAFRAGKVSLAVAQLVARIPNADVMEEAANRILNGYGNRPLSVADAQRFIFEECMTALKNAPFDTKDKTLVADAGPCSACLKRTGNEKELFADVGRSDVCTDTICFKAKADAARARLLAKAKEEGKAILSPAESAQLYPHHGHLSYEAPYVELTATCPFAPKKTWADIVAKLPKAERPQVAVALDKNGSLHELIGRKEAVEAAHTLKLAKPSETRGDISAASVQQRCQLRESRERHERTIRTVDLVINALLEKQGKAKDNKALARLVFMVAMHEAHFDTQRRVAKRYGYTTPKKDGDAASFFKARAKAADPLLFALETLLWECSLFVNSGLPDAVVQACTIYGLDLKKIEAAAKEKPAKVEPKANPELPVKAAPAKAKPRRKS